MVDIEFKQVKRLCKVVFTQKEKLDLLDRWSSAVTNMNEAQAELKGIKAQYESRIKQAEAEIETLHAKASAGWEMRNIECEEIKDYSTGTYFVRRKDTGERIEERALTLEERQLEIQTEKNPEPPAEEIQEAIAEPVPSSPEVQAPATELRTEDGILMAAPLEELPDMDDPFYVGKESKNGVRNRRK